MKSALLVVLSTLLVNGCVCRPHDAENGSARQVDVPKNWSQPPRPEGRHREKYASTTRPINFRAEGDRVEIECFTTRDAPPLVTYRAHGEDAILKPLSYLVYEDGTAYRYYLFHARGRILVTLNPPAKHSVVVREFW